jgi:hypothetical protein
VRRASHSVGRWIVDDLQCRAGRNIAGTSHAADRSRGETATRPIEHPGLSCFFSLSCRDSSVNRIPFRDMPHELGWGQSFQSLSSEVNAHFFCGSGGLFSDRTGAPSFEGLELPCSACFALLSSVIGSWRSSALTFRSKSSKDF